MTDAASSRGRESGSDPAVRVVLAADDPAALAAFYGALLQRSATAGLGPGHWILPLPAGGTLEIYAPSRRRPRPAGPSRLALCLARRGDGETLEWWLARATALGAALEEGPRTEPFGWEAWLADPEGNAVLLLVEPPQAP
jgi:predicted enzyme related to lactoylglutathione lyase